MNQEQLAELHKLIDEWAAKQGNGEITFQEPEEPKKELPKDKRVIRTKSTGDRVYLIDEKAKTKAWVTSPEVLEKLGFGLNDVEDVEDKDLVGYAMTASIYKVD